MQEIIDFALWLNTQRIAPHQYMDREELEEMYKIYLEYLSKKEE